MGLDFSSNIECSHCGATFYYELTRCPKCGVNIYNPETEADGEFSNAIKQFVDNYRFPLGILAGWLATIVLSLSLYIPIRFAFTMPQYGYIIYTLALACIIVGGFAGGFFAVRVAKEKVILTTALVGLVSVGIAIVILLREWRTPLPFPGVVLGWLAILAASFAGTKVAEKMLNKATLQSLFIVPPTEEDLYQNLFIKTGHDHNITKRLIEYERQRSPQATRAELIRNAIRRWERDNRTGPLLN